MELNLDELIFHRPAAEPAKDNRAWSPFQSDIFTHILEVKNSRIIEAVAGSGKTTTIVEGMKYLPQGSRAAFLAFNRSIADELGTKVPPGVQASTFHALGNAALRAYNPRLRMDKGKVWKYLKDNYNNKYQKLFFPAKKLVDLVRSGLPSTGDQDPRLYAALIDNYDIEIPEIERGKNCEDAVIAMAMHAMQDLTDPGIKTYDFCDMLYLPVKWQVPMQQYDNIFVDEVQDTADIQRDLLRMSLGAGGLLTAVGDTFQAIYGFRGANTESMEITKREFNCDALPLSISYRCPKAIVELARTICPHIEPAETAIEGRVNREVELDIAQLSPEDMILCRNNSPLLELALQLLAARKPMRLLGDFQEMLESFIRRFDCDTCAQLERSMARWLEKETEECMAKEQYGKLARARDKVECVNVLLSGHMYVEELLDTLAKLFIHGMGPTLSSIHKAKGMESDKIWILRPDLMPSKYAKTDAAKQQESNLFYVAITRARRELNFIAVQENESE